MKKVDDNQFEKTAIAIIQARMSSSRLPGKVLKPLAGKPMLWHIVERAKACRLVDKVVVATSIEPTDDVLHDFCSEAGIECFRGSLDNVLSRFLNILRQWPHDYFVRITGDCPLIHPDFIDKQILALQAHDGDLVWLADRTPTLDGQGVHSYRSLQLISEYSKHPDDLEHVGSSYFANHPEEFRIIGIHPPESLRSASWRLTVDEKADYEMMRQIYADLWRGEPIALEDAFDWLGQHPKMSSLNQSVQHSAINQEIDAKRQEWVNQVSLYCKWDEPHVLNPLIERPQFMSESAERCY